ncbi:MAG: DUF2723 domain-containing protein [Anaerolineae bacterium]
MSDGRSRSAFRVPHSALADGLLGLASFLVYLSTCLPSVLSADNGEFQLVAWKLGIAHPPGYALYTIVGWLFSRFFASPAFALNLLSAVLASITLVVVSRTVRRLTQSTIAGLLAAALLGTSTTFWAQATTANIRMPTALFTALCVSLLVEWSRSRREQARSARHLVIFAYIFSLGLGHHLSLAFPGVFFIIYILLNDRGLIKQPRRWLAPLIAFALGLLVLLYLPLRGATGGTLADGETTTYLAQPDKFLDHVLARGFEGDFFYFVNTRSDLLADRAALLPTLFTFQFNPLVIALVLIGAARLIRRDWKLAVMLLGGIALHTFVAITYRAPQTVEYLIPAYVLLAIVVGYGLQTVSIQKSGARILTAGFWLLAAILIVLQFANNLPSFNWLRDHDDTRAYAESLLNDAPPNAIILSNWHWANPMWYLQQVEGVRGDVEVQYVYPRGETLAQSWLKAIDAGSKAKRPVVVDMFFRSEFDSSPYMFEPLGREAWLVRESPRTDLPTTFTASDFNFSDLFRVSGYRVTDQPTTPGEPLTVQIAYRVLQTPARDYSFFVHLVAADGRVIGQADRTLPTTRYQANDVIVERFRIAPLLDVPPGDYAIMTGIYSTSSGTLEALKADGQERVTLTTATVAADQRLVKANGIALSGGITLVRSTASINGEVHPGDRLTLDLAFTAARPILRDYVVSVQMTGPGWRVTDDSVPALGAIPTLKWLAGTQIADRHALTIPAKAAPGLATISVIVYDNFTQEPLALLDAELIKQGQSIPLGVWNVVTR